MKTIVWDVDDVLNCLTKEWFENYWLKIKPDYKISYSQINKNPPFEILSISLEEYLQSLDNFRKNNFHNLKPVKEILNWFNINGNNYRHIALTATPLEISGISAEWVLKYFGKWIRSFNFVPSKRNTDSIIYYDKNKAEFLTQFKNIDIFIDDSEININDVKNIGIKTLLFPQPWNSNANTSLMDFLNKINI